MTIKMIEGIHLTATNKRHIAELIENGKTSGGTQKLFYRITERDGNKIALTIYQRDRNMAGRAFTRKNNFVVEVA